MLFESFPKKSKEKLSERKKGKEKNSVGSCHDQIILTSIFIG